jgi:4-aminobutyrate aminotransferase
MNDPRPPADASAEGDVNTSPLRPRVRSRARACSHARAARRRCDVFLHQSLSTPCFNALASCDGIWLTDVEGRRVMDFHGNNVHQVGYRHPHVMAAVRQQLDTLPFLAAALHQCGRRRPGRKAR